MRDNVTSWAGIEPRTFPGALPPGSAPGFNGEILEFVIFFAKPVIFQQRKNIKLSDRLLAQKIKTLKIFIKKSAKYANFRCALPLNLNPGSASESYVKNTIQMNLYALFSCPGFLP
jgi:hypothetical protein